MRMKGRIHIVLFILLSVSSYMVYQYTSTPSYIETKGGDNIVPIISLVTSIIGLIGTIISFAAQLIGLKKLKSNEKLEGGSKE